MTLYDQVGTEENGKRVIKVVKLQPRPAAKWRTLQPPKSTMPTTESRSAYATPGKIPSAHDPNGAKKLVAYRPDAARNQIPRRFRKEKDVPLRLGQVDEVCVPYAWRCMPCKRIASATHSSTPASSSDEAKESSRFASLIIIVNAVT